MTEGFWIDRNDGRIYVMGVTAISGGVYFSLASRGEACVAVFYRKGTGSPKGRIRPPANVRTGDAWSMTAPGNFSGLEYVHEVGRQQMPNPYGRRFTGVKRWGSPVHLDESVYTPVGTKGSAYDWEGDIPPRIPYGQYVIYHIHPREFIKRVSSGVEGDSRKTFKGVVEKIPYLKDLGIVTMETMPPVELEESIIPERVDGSPLAAEKPDGKLNYWGCTRGYHSAPKCAYNSGSVRQPERESKDVVEALYKTGLELVLELFFDGKEAPLYVLDVVRFRAQEYHVDGARLVGYMPVKSLGEDFYLSRLKLLAPEWDGVEPGQVECLAEYNDGFIMDMCSFLKGDEDQLNHLVYCIRHNPRQVGVINYMANTSGFTLMGMVFYDIRHNEVSGENDRDGTDYNQFWNCGAEGPSRKRRVMQMHRKRIRNTLLMPFLSQGTPLLMMGDELGHTKNENNSSYYQDNDVLWPNWSLLNSNSNIYEFVKHVIRSRKEHSVFYMEKKPALMDYHRVGLSGMSYHGLKTWCLALSRFLCQLGILYCGKYSKKSDGRENDYFCVVFNMHWESHGFALPNLSKDFKWYMAFNADEDRVSDMYPRGGESILENQKFVTTMARTVVVPMGKEVVPLRKAVRGKATGKGERREEEAYDIVRGDDMVYRGPQAGGIRSSSETGQNTGALQS